MTGGVGSDRRLSYDREVPVIFGVVQVVVVGSDLQ
jgi:hypothetical protein